MLELLNDAAAIERFSTVRGEAACLICFQRGQFMLWISIGDNLLYLLHPELERLGQHTLTARSYFEWIGARNSLTLGVPCFSSGVRELRAGTNTIALVTDGLLEVAHRPYEDPLRFSRAICGEKGLRLSIAAMLAEVHELGATDSATVVAWTVTNPHPGLMPTPS